MKLLAASEETVGPEAKSASLSGNLRNSGAEVPSFNEAQSWSKLLSGQNAGRFCVSTDDLPEKHRMEILNEVAATRTFRQRVTPQPSHRFFLNADVCVMPGLVSYRSSASPVSVHRGPEFLSDGNDSFVLSCTRQARVIHHLGRELTAGPGEAVLFSASDRLVANFSSCFDGVAISVPRKVLRHLAPNAEDCLMRPVPAQSPALRLLLHYLNVLRDEDVVGVPDLQRAAVAHVYDLFGVLFGATDDAMEAARHRGIQAARLHVIKKDIRESLADNGLSVSAIAARHRLTPRYVQMLFECTGTTFTEFVRNERLDRTHQMLSNPRFHGRKIVEIALACGLGDLSHFNRDFRARFGAAPSDVRKNAAG